MDKERKRTMLNELGQILWALLLVYLVLASLVYLFGKQIGFAAALKICLGVGLLVTVTFAGLYLLTLLLHLRNRR